MDNAHRVIVRINACDLWNEKMHNVNGEATQRM
jgi:hypothetical protein